MEAKGHVVLENDEGLQVTTDEATYSSGEEIVRAPHKVDFTKGNMSGSGVGMTLRPGSATSSGCSTRR